MGMGPALHVQRSPRAGLLGSTPSRTEALHQAIRPLHLLLFVAIMAIWSLNFVIMKWGVAEIPPILFSSLRFALVAVLLAPFAPPPRGQWRQIFLISFTLGVLHFSCIFSGMARTPGSTGALLVQLQVPFAAILAAIFLDDRLGWRRLAGMILAFAGVVLVLGGPDLSAPWWSLGLVVAASLFWAVATVQIKKLHGISGLTLNAWVAVLSVPQLLIVSFVLEEGQVAALAAASWRAYGSVLYNSVGIVLIGYGLWYQLLRRYDVNQAMPFTLLVAPFGVFFSALLLDEPLAWTLLLGGAITLAGVAIIVLRRPRLAPPEAERV